jgi:alanyl-tRNA synthetase
MGAAYPELTQHRSQAERVLAEEEVRFAETLNSGMTLLAAAIREMSGTVIDGATVFKLYDTYGFPVDLTADIARERQLTIDQAGFETAMDAQRKRAQAASRFGVDLRGATKVDSHTHFHGYDSLSGESLVVALLKAGTAVEQLQAGEGGEVFLEATPFYAESGGQVGDAGELAGPGMRFIVSDTLKRGKAFAHVGRVVEGRISLGDRLGAQVDVRRRAATVLNHSATHLLHAALRQVLGAHVQQKGSLVAPDRLRFDFAHFQPVTPAELTTIERLVNAQIRANAPAQTAVMEYEQAVASGAMALFGEKYDKDVRVLRIGDFSVELCGGTHVGRAGDIGLFKIIAESGVASGVRRIEAITGEKAIDYMEQHEALIRQVAGQLRGSPEEVPEKVRDVLERVRQMEREIRTLKDKLASGSGVDLAAGAIDVQGVKVVAAQVEGADSGALRNAVDQLKSRLGSAVIVLGSIDAQSKVLLVAGVTADQTSRLKAGELIGSVAAQIGGKGGGRADFAQAGGSDATALPSALAGVEAWVRQRLSA